MTFIKTALAFFKKDFLISLSYRFEFLLQVFSMLFTVTGLYYLGKLIDNADVPFLKAYGGNYFGFIVIGFAFNGYVGVSINTFFNNIREGQLTGTLEIILSSPTRLFTYLFSSSLWSSFFVTLRLLLYFLMGIFVFGLEIGKANLFAAGVIFTLSIICYIGIGILMASLVLVVKRGESSLKFVLGGSAVLSGLVFPIELLPPVLKKIALFLPLTYSFRGLRLSVLEGYTFRQLQMDEVILFGYAVIFMIISLFVFPYAINRAKVKGSLAEY